MTEQTHLSDEQLTTLARGASAAFLVVVGADPANPISMIREGHALAKAFKKSKKDQTHPPAIAAVVEHLDQHQKQIGRAPDGTDSMDDLAELGRDWLREAAAVAVTLTPEERDAYSRWVMSMARASAEAVDEKDAHDRVSPGEQQALQDIEAVLGGPPTA